jgi:hypothetical protein
MLEGVFIDQAIEVHFEFTGHFGRSTGARAVDEALRALVSKALHPLAQGRIRKLEGVGNGLEALPFDDIAHGLRTAKDAGLLRLLQKGVQGGQGVIGKVEFEGPHGGGLQNKLLQKSQHPTWFPYYRSTAFLTQIFQELLIVRQANWRCRVGASPIW